MHAGAGQRDSTRGNDRLSASAENIPRKKTRDFRARSEEMLGIQKSRERSISERSVSQEDERSGDISPGPKFGSNKSVFSSFIDGVKNLANRLSEKAGSKILDHYLLNHS